MLADIRYHMLHACSLPSFPSAIQCNTKNNLFQCTDGRCISIHRLLDGRKDCTQGQDELSNETCILNLPDRYKCDNGQRCISTTLILDQHVSRNMITTFFCIFLFLLDALSRWYR